LSNISYIMVRTSYISMRWRWWWYYLVCTRSTCWFYLYKATTLTLLSVVRHVAPLGHIFWIWDHQSLLLLLNVALNTNCIVFICTQSLSTTLEANTLTITSLSTTLEHTYHYIVIYHTRTHLPLHCYLPHSRRTHLPLHRYLPHSRQTH
jgi:hypothetical protein